MIFLAKVPTVTHCSSLTYFSSDSCYVQILWPGGIFLTKHPKRQAASPPSAHSNSINNNLTNEQRLEAAHRANFVRELIIGE